MNANRRPDGTGAVSIETASKVDSSDPWTAQQVEQLILLGVWLHRQHGIPLRICRSWDDPGYGYHRLFPQWSDGGTDCPGDARAKQFGDAVFPGIVARASKGQLPPPGPAVVRRQVTIGGLTYGYGAHGPQVRAVGEALVAAGHGSHYLSGPDEEWRDPDTLNYAEYQRSLGYSGADADGVPGEESLRRLLGFVPAPRTVSLARLVAAARVDPGAAQGHLTHGYDVRIVEQALADEGLLDPTRVDGSLGTSTIEAYAGFQRRLGYRGADADGIPGQRSLSELGDRHDFTVTD